MQDLISRQAVIDVVHKSIFDFFDICDDNEESSMTYKDKQLLEINKAITTRIKDLPSAQPEIIRCKECKFYTEMRQDLNTGICSLACRHLGGDGFCSEAERRTDG